jgi:hypothetical protein
MIRPGDTPPETKQNMFRPLLLIAFAVSITFASEETTAKVVPIF